MESNGRAGSNRIASWTELYRYGGVSGHGVVSGGVSFVDGIHYVRMLLGPRNA